MTLAQIREGLRAARVARKRDGLTLDRLQERSTVDRAVIHRIENVRKYPTYEPGMDTVLRLIEGMGLSPSAFFRQIEEPRPETAHGSQSSVLSNEKRVRENTAVAEGTLSYGGRSIPATTDSIALQTLIEGLSATLDRLEERLPKDRERRTKARARKAKNSQGRTRRVS